MLCLAAPALPGTLSAQTITGATLDEALGTPVGGASVRLMSQEGEAIAATLSDPGGRFALTPPATGTFRIVTSRIGYVQVASPLFEFGTIDSVDVEVLMRPAPIGLGGLTVEVDVVSEAAEALEMSGIHPPNLGRRWITRADLETVQVRSDIGRVLEWQQISNLRIIRPENLSAGSDPMGLCLSLTRARTGAGLGRCAIGVVDGRAVSNDEMLHLDPETVEAMAVLIPTEATILFGQRGEAGALMIWTRHARD